MTLSTTERMEVIPIIILVDGAQSEQGFSTFDCPKHAGQFATVFDEMATGAFDDAGADGPAVAQILGVVHVGLIAAEVIGDLVQGFGDLTGGDERRGFLFEALDDEVGATGEEVEGLGLDPHGALRVGFAIESGTGLPEIFDGMDDVQDEDKARQLGQNLVLERLGAIAEGDALEDVLAPAASGSFGQFSDGLFLALERGENLLVAGSWTASGGFALLEEALGDDFGCSGIGLYGIDGCGDRFLLRRLLVPFLRRTFNFSTSCLTSGTPFPSACTTRIGPSSDFGKRAFWL